MWVSVNSLSPLRCFTSNFSVVGNRSQPDEVLRGTCVTDATCGHAGYHFSSDFQVSRHIIISALGDRSFSNDYSSNYHDYALQMNDYKIKIKCQLQKQ